MEGLPEGAGIVGWIAALGALVWAAYERLSPRIALSRERIERAEDRVTDSVMGEHQRLLERLDALVTRIESLEEKNDSERRLRISAENRNAVLMRRLITLGHSELSEFESEE